MYTWAHVSRVISPGELFDSPMCILPFLACRHLCITLDAGASVVFYFSSGMISTVLPVTMIIATKDGAVNASNFT